MSRKSKRATNPPERIATRNPISSSGDEDDMWRKKEETVQKYRVKENRSTKHKIHLLLHAIPLGDPNVSLGKRNRDETKKFANKPRPKRQKQEFIEDSESEEFELPNEEETFAEIDPETYNESSSDGEAQLLQRKATKLTRRQKAMVAEEPMDFGLQALPMGNEKRELTEEDKNKKSEKARRRKRQAERQQEEERRNVIDRLLNKSKTKRKDKHVTVLEKMKQEIDLSKCLRYAQYSKEEEVISTLTFPEGTDISFPGTRDTPPVPSVILCSVDGCKNRKKYNCITTHAPLCSISCYKKHNTASAC